MAVVNLLTVFPPVVDSKLDPFRECSVRTVDGCLNVWVWFVISLLCCCTHVGYLDFYSFFFFLMFTFVVVVVEFDQGKICEM